MTQTQMLEDAGLLELVLAEPNQAQIIADGETLFAAYQDARAKGFNQTVSAMIKAGTLKAEVGALARTATLVVKLLDDKDHGPQVEAFIQSIL